jgi:hypothetical protein
VKRPTPPPWKKLYAQALKARTNKQQLIEQARRALLDRTVAIANKEGAASDRERRALEAALRDLWNVEHHKPG